MSDYENKDPIALAKQAEKDMNSYENKQGHSGSLSTGDSGVDESVEAKFPGAKVEYGTGQGDNRTVPESEGGGINPRTGQNFKQGDFEGQGGPEDQAAAYAAANPGNDDVRGNIRQGGETSRPLGGKLPSEGQQ